MDLALNNLQRLICHKTKQSKPSIICKLKINTCLLIDNPVVVIINTFFCYGKALPS